MPSVTADTTLEQLFRLWPETLHVFIQHGCICPGCSIAPWHSVRDTCREYGFDEAAFVEELRSAAAAADQP